MFGHVLSSISPTNASGGTTTTTYDADGNELTNEDPSSDTTTSTYSPDDLLCWSEPLSVSSPSCSSPPTGTGTQTTTNTFDPDGNQVFSVARDGNATGPSCLYETSSTFDDLGDTLSETTPSGGTTCANETTSTTSYTYDADRNQLTSVAPPPPGQSGDVTTTSTYDADNEVCWSDIAVSTSPTAAPHRRGAGPRPRPTPTTLTVSRPRAIPPDGNASGSPSSYAATSTYNGAGELTSQTVPPRLGPEPGRRRRTTTTRMATPSP